ncbi:MAG TPA: thiamine phosphate synthase [Bryobacteraceae bacterium]|nr:thiamine phosphate synthase [Bryobacteraceae bacterium]
MFPRVYPILDGAILQQRGVALRQAAEALLEGGASILQLRWKDFFSAEVFQHAEEIGRLCLQAGATFVVNDRADMALLLNAGLHVGQDDLTPSQARTVIGPDRLLGVSTHNQIQFAKATSEPVHYLAIGPIYATASKTNPDPIVGTLELARLRELTDKPLIAIGGIDLSNSQDVFRAGADSVAIISGLYPVGCSKATIRERFEEWQRTAGQ